MQEIKIGNLTFSIFEIGKELKGFAMPPIRTSSSNFSGKDGGFVSGQFYGMRELVVPLTIDEDNSSDLVDRRAQIVANLPIRQNLDMFVKNFKGEVFYAQVRVIDADIDIDSFTDTDPVITLLMPDPYFYDAGNGVDPESGWIEQDINKIVGGGYITPYILPVEWEAGSTPAIVQNNGDITIYPQIILEDQWTNPQITNNTTGMTVKLDVTTTSGDVIVIDQKNQTVTLNGGNILPTRDTDLSTWWGLLPGDNSISIFSDGGSDNSQGVIRYRQGYLSA